MTRLIKTVMAYYVNMQTIKSHEDLTAVPHADISIQLSNHEMFIATDARKNLSLLEDEETPDMILRFYK